MSAARPRSTPALRPLYARSTLALRPHTAAKLPTDWVNAWRGMRHLKRWLRRLRAAEARANERVNARVNARLDARDNA